MKRKDEEITDRKEIEAVISHCEVCRLAIMDDDGFPYIVPMSYGFSADGQYLYFHASQKGKKLEIMRRNSKCGFEISDIEMPEVGGRALWAQKYKSIIGRGHVEFVEDLDEKMEIVHTIINHNTKEKREFNMPVAALNHMVVIRLKIEIVTGRKADVALIDHKGHGVHPGGHPGGMPLMGGHKE